jgi:hypothetical protein
MTAGRRGATLVLVLVLEVPSSSVAPISEIAENKNRIHRMRCRSRGARGRDLGDVRAGSAGKLCGGMSMMGAGMAITMSDEGSLRNMIFDIARPEAQCPLYAGSSEEVPTLSYAQDAQNGAMT